MIGSVYSLKVDPERYEYYVGGELVTEDVYHDCRSQNIQKETMKFSCFELTCAYPITAEQAWNLANAYWDNQDGCTEGAAGTVYVTRIVLVDTPDTDTDCYRVALRTEGYSGGGVEGYECLPPHSIREMGEISVNAFSGEIMPLPDPTA